MRLSICIPTVLGREAQFEALQAELFIQRKVYGYDNDIEIISICDNKEISIGAKRQKLYEQAQGEYTVQIDDDDWIAPTYIEDVMKCLEGNDCVGYVERCTINGKTMYSKISNEFDDWATVSPNEIEGFHYQRTPFFKVPIKTSLCLQVGVNDLRFGEDHDFARRIKPLLKSEIFINKALYYYTANSLTPQEHKERYGL
jgi:glycosyltransferase involved in cell wall biosynthesis